MIKYNEEDLDLLENFDNEAKELLKCPNCGKILTQLDSIRDMRRYETYKLNYTGIEFDDLEDAVELDGRIIKCHNCNYELSEEHIDQLEELDILRL